MAGLPGTAGCKWWQWWTLDFEVAQQRADNYHRRRADRQAAMTRRR